MESRNKDAVAKDGRKRMFLTTCIPSPFTHRVERVLTLSGHQNCLAVTRSVTFILHLLPASALSAIPTRSNWPLQSSRARTVRKDTTWPSMLTTTASTALPGFRWKTPTLPHSLHEHCNTEWRCLSHQSTQSATRSSRAAFARTTSAAGYIVGEPWKSTFQGSSCSRRLNF